MNRCRLFLTVFISVTLASAGLAIPLPQEHLVFDVWKVVIVGQASFSIIPLEKHWEITYHGRTNFLGSIFKKIDKTGISIGQAENFKPQTFIHQGRVSSLQQNQRWDIQNNSTVIYRDLRQETEKNFESADTLFFDILSGLAFFRSYILPNWNNIVVQDTAKLTVIKNVETVKVPIIYMGEKQLSQGNELLTVDLFEIKVGQLGEKLFGTDASLLVYFDKTPARHPVRMQTDISFAGTITAVLNKDKSTLTF